MSIDVSFFVLALLCVATCVSRVLSFDFEDDVEDTLGKAERPYIDHVREDDRDEFDLYDIMALTLANVDYDFDIYTPEQKQLALDIHNIYRINLTHSFPQSSDEFMFEYNNTLEWAACMYLKHCFWGHEFHALDNMTWSQGQNLYKGSSKLISRAFYLYYTEYRMWYHNNWTCWTPYSKYKCGHMTQMLWGNSSHLGTARRSYCWPLDKDMFFNTHYIRDGNKLNIGMYFYQVGWPCTRCPPGWLCACGKLCVPPRYCTAYNLDCECSLACKNCGKPDYKRCRCECKKGWDWWDCSFPCMDLLTKYNRRINCARNFPSRCTEEGQEAFFFGCSRRCGKCRGISKKDKPEELCCGGKICEEYYELDEDTCECKLMCPSWNKCLYPPSTTTTTIAPPTTTAAATTTTKPSKPKSDAVALQPSLPIVILYVIYLPLRLLLTPTNPF